MSRSSGATATADTLRAFLLHVGPDTPVVVLDDSPGLRAEGDEAVPVRAELCLLSAHGRVRPLSDELGDDQIAVLLSPRIASLEDASMSDAPSPRCPPDLPRVAPGGRDDGTTFDEQRLVDLVRAFLLARRADLGDSRRAERLAVRAQRALAAAIDHAIRDAIRELDEDDRRRWGGGEAADDEARVPGPVRARFEARTTGELAELAEHLCSSHGRSAPLLIHLVNLSNEPSSDRILPGGRGVGFGVAIRPSDVEDAPLQVSAVATDEAESETDLPPLADDAPGEPA